MGYFAQCHFLREDRVAQAEWVGTVLVWDRCLNRDGNRHWEMIAVHKNGTAILNLALNLCPKEADEVAELALTSWRVNPDAVPLGSVELGADGEQPLPVPPWHKSKQASPSPT